MNESSTYKELIQISKKKKKKKESKKAVKNGQITKKEMLKPNNYMKIHSTLLFQRKTNWKKIPRLPKIWDRKYQVLMTNREMSTVIRCWRKWQPLGRVTTQGIAPQCCFWYPHMCIESHTWGESPRNTPQMLKQGGRAINTTWIDLKTYMNEKASWGKIKCTLYVKETKTKTKKLILFWTANFE